MPPPPHLLGLAAGQGGALARAQAHAFGVSDKGIDRLVREGWWHRLGRGVYSLGEPTWIGLAWGATLATGPRGILGLQAAAHLQGLADEPATIDVFVGSSGRHTDAARWRFHRADRMGVGRPARTRPADTVIDLAASLEAESVTRLVTDAVSRGLTSTLALRRTLDARAKHSRRHLLG
jgi:very-short-patch-repair endonuclease